MSYPTFQDSLGANDRNVVVSGKSALDATGTLAAMMIGTTKR